MHDEIQGLPGELVERLTTATNPPLGTDWLELTWWVVFAIGGDRLRGIVPDTGTEPAPGTMGSELRKSHHVVSRDEHLNQIRKRLLELVNSGLREDVLVRALRDDLTLRLKEQSDTAHANEKRQTMRENLERSTEDFDMISDFRARIAQDYPEYLSLTDDQVIEQLHAMAERLAPIPLERELDTWARLDRWTARANALISDEVIAEWLDRYAKRMVSRGFSE